MRPFSHVVLPDALLAGSTRILSCYCSIPAGLSGTGRKRLTAITPAISSSLIPMKALAAMLLPPRSVHPVPKAACKEATIHHASLDFVLNFCVLMSFCPNCSLWRKMLRTQQLRSKVMMVRGASEMPSHLFAHLQPSHLRDATVADAAPAAPYSKPATCPSRLQS